MSSSNTPAGWYTDPEDAAQLRHWDGSAWTEHRASGGAPPHGHAASQAREVPAASTQTANEWRAADGSTSSPAKPWYRRGWGIAVIVVGFLFVVGALFGEDSETTPAASETPSVSPTPADEPAMTAAEKEAAEQEAAEQEAEEAAEAERAAAEEAAEARKQAKREAAERAAAKREAARKARAEKAAATQKFSGAGAKVLRIDKGDEPMVATITHQGSSNFSIFNIDSSGADIDLLVNEIGSYAGTVLFDAMEGERTAALKVEADGPWSITMRPVQYARSWDSGKSIKGNGSDVLVVNEVFDGGLATANITHSGSSNFAVFAYGDSQDLLVNEIGRYKGEVLVPGGTVVLELEADGPWAIKRTG
jgi:hypothetical protein